jgi:alanine racemase
VRIRGQKCPFFGSVCMDKSTIDIGSLPLAEGDEITLFGE